MLKSMTAFGRCKETVNGKDITVEIRSVNNRYFDCSVRLPKIFSFLEEKIKPYLQSKGISRGKVDVFIGVELLESKNVSISLDSAYAKGYIDALHQLKDTFNLKDDISVMSVAQNRDIFTIKTTEDETDKYWQEVCVVLDKALEIFMNRRITEGKNLQADMCEKIKLIKTFTSQIEALSAEDVESHNNKLRERLRQIINDNNVIIDDSRILTECAIFADKIAVDEELTRLSSHFQAFDEILLSSEPSGRKLDFLIQEMNRETNTIGSKCNNSKIAHIVVNIKNELEKIREQIQNIE